MIKIYIDTKFKNDSKTGYTYIYRNKRIYFIHTVSRRYFSTNPIYKYFCIALFLHQRLIAATVSRTLILKSLYVHACLR